MAGVWSEGEEVIRAGMEIRGSDQPIKTIYAAC